MSTLPPPPRVWLYRRGEWAGPLLFHSTDEYGRHVLILRLPGQRGLVAAYRTCHCDDCTILRMEDSLFLEAMDDQR